jgi:hypothetical protein
MLIGEVVKLLAYARPAKPLAGRCPLDLCSLS